MGTQGPPRMLKLSEDIALNSQHLVLTTECTRAYPIPKQRWYIFLVLTLSLILWSQFSHSVISDSLWPHGQWPTRLLCPWDFSRQEPWVDCHFLLQGIFLTQGSNSFLLHCQADSLLLVPPSQTQFPESMLLLQVREGLPLSHAEHFYHLSTQQKPMNDSLLNQ